MELLEGNQLLPLLGHLICQLEILSFLKCLILLSDLSAGLFRSRSQDSNFLIDFIDLLVFAINDLLHLAQSVELGLRNAVNGLSDGLKLQGLLIMLNCPLGRLYFGEKLSFVFLLVEDRLGGLFDYLFTSKTQNIGGRRGGANIGGVAAAREGVTALRPAHKNIIH